MDTVVGEDAGDGPVPTVTSQGACGRRGVAPHRSGPRSIRLWAKRHARRARPVSRVRAHLVSVRMLARLRPLVREPAALLTKLLPSLLQGTDSPGLSLRPSPVVSFWRNRSVHSLPSSARTRLSLSRVTALVVIGLAFAAVPGVMVSRVAGRDTAARMTRGGFYRLGSSEAALHVVDDHDPANTPAGDVVSSIRQLEHAPPGPPGAPPGARFLVAPPISTFVLLDAPSPTSFHPAALADRPRGRAPPAL